MNKEDLFIIVFLIILATSIIYFYRNIESFDCFMDQNFGNVMSDIKYEFEPEGSLYGKTRIYRFIISSSMNRLEYYGMSISTEDGETLFFDNRTEPEGGSIVTTISLKSENDIVVVSRFFKKKCYPEVQL